jgi:hypothetical protein
MKANFFLIISALLILTAPRLMAQDSTVVVQQKTITLSEVVVRTDLNVPKFIDRVKNDTTFYKAFKNLHILNFTALNDIRMMDKKGNVKASLQSRTQQQRSGGCRTMTLLEEQAVGDIYDAAHNFNYYTAQMYAGLIFTSGKVCGETNIVAGTELSTKGKKGMAKHREQLKMLFFNPGKRIPGLPFIANKVALFDPDVAALYDFLIDKESFGGKDCFVFRITTREGLSKDERDNVVIDAMTTWFDERSFEIVARNWHLSYNAGVYDFDVQMEVQMTKAGELLVPRLIRYTGNWDVITKKRERGVFTATLFDFKAE